MREGDAYYPNPSNIVERVEVRELEPLTFEEAKAMVILLGGVEKPEPIYSPGIGLAGRFATPLARLFASLPPRQRQAFRVTMDGVWPRPQRNQKKPHGIHGGQQWWDGHAIDDWNDAWAAAFAAASRERETVMAEALIKAKGLHSV